MKPPLKNLIIWLIAALVFVTCMSPWLRAEEPWLTRPTPMSTVVLASVCMNGGNLADGLTSWKQPESTKWLATDGKFYRHGARNKMLVSGVVTGALMVVAWKWPRVRRIVIVFNLAMGATFYGAAANNIARNPYYR